MSEYNQSVPYKCMKKITLKSISVYKSQMLFIIKKIMTGCGGKQL